MIVVLASVIGSINGVEFLINENDALETLTDINQTLRWKIKCVKGHFAIIFFYLILYFFILLRKIVCSIQRA